MSSAQTIALVPIAPERRPGLVRLTSPTWAVAVERFLGWLALVRGRAPLTVTAYGRGLQGFVRFAQAQGLADPRQVTHREIEDYLGWLARPGPPPGGPAPTSLGPPYVLSLPRAGRRRPHESRGLVAFGPKKAPRFPAYLTVPEQEHLLAALAAVRGLTGQRDYAMVATALLTGLRCEELCRLRLDHVSFEGGFLRVRGKGAKVREVPLVPRLARDPPRPTSARRARGWCSARTRPTCSRPTSAGAPTSTTPRRRARGVPLTTRGFFHVVRVACSAIVGRPVHPHMLRHSFASRLRAKGADLQLIQEILGHESINTTTMYAHISTPLRTATVARLLEA